MGLGMVDPCDSHEQMEDNKAGTCGLSEQIRGMGLDWTDVLLFRVTGREAVSLGRKNSSKGIKLKVNANMCEQVSR